MLLFIQIFALATISRLFEWMIGPDVLSTYGRDQPLGHPFIPFYFILSLIIFNRAISRETPVRKFNFSVAYGYKLLFATLMTYLVVTQYQFGDFLIYYDLPSEISRAVTSLHWENMPDFNFSPTFAIAWIFSIVFLILPPSLYGLTLLSGTVVFIAWLKTYRMLESEIEYKRVFFAVFFFTPSLTLQLGYTGKETLVIPLLAWALILFKKGSNAVYKIIVIALIFIIRFYQAIFLVVAWMFFRFRIRLLLTLKGVLLVVLACLIGAVIYRYSLEKISHYGFTSIFDLAKFISLSYSSGSLVLDPLPFPLTFLQTFRPFPWEANNALSLVVSIESITLLFLVAYLSFARKGELIWRFKRDSFFRFLFIYVFVQAFIFGFDNNMGDLARRKIYYLPLLIALLCYRKGDTAPSASTLRKE